MLGTTAVSSLSRVSGLRLYEASLKRILSKRTKGECHLSFNPIEVSIFDWRVVRGYPYCDH